MRTNISYKVLKYILEKIKEFATRLTAIEETPIEQINQNNTSKTLTIPELTVFIPIESTKEEIHDLKETAIADYINNLNNLEVLETENLYIEVTNFILDYEEEEKYFKYTTTSNFASSGLWVLVTETVKMNAEYTIDGELITLTEAKEVILDNKIYNTFALDLSKNTTNKPIIITLNNATYIEEVYLTESK